MGAQGTPVLLGVASQEEGRSQDLAAMRDPNPLPWAVWPESGLRQDAWTCTCFTLGKLPAYVRPTGLPTPEQVRIAP